MTRFIANHPILSALLLLPIAGLLSFGVSWLAPLLWFAGVVGVLVLRAGRPKPNQPQALIGGTLSSQQRDTMLAIVGTSHYNGLDALPEGPVKVTLRREPSNSHDPNAIAAWVGKYKLGYLSATAAAKHAAALDRAGGTVQVQGVREGGNVVVQRPAGPAEAAPEPVAIGESIEPWGELTQIVEVDGEADHRAGVRAVFASQGASVDRGGIELDDIPTLLVAKTGQPPAVICAGQLVGTLDRTAAGAYRAAFDDLAARGLALSVRARVWAREDGVLHSRVSVRMPDADEVTPPMPLPAERFAVIPQRTRYEVSGEEAYLDRLLGLLGGAGQVKAVATLHGVDVARARSSARLVEVRIQGEPVGVLSKVASDAMLPLVEGLAAAGVLPVAHAIITGNQLKVDVAIRVTRASELPPEWVAQHVSAGSNGIARA